jgi:hypothetical protein
MAFLNETYDVDQLPQSTGSYDPLPAGWYHANITQAELMNTKAGNGQYIKIRYDITGPSHQGRVVFGNLNIKNPNPKAEEIGRQQLGEIMRAIGIPRVTDTDQLIGGNLQIKLDIRESEQYGAQNEVKGFKAIAGSMSVAPAVKDAPAAASGKAAPPWAKK